MTLFDPEVAGAGERPAEALTSPHARRIFVPGTPVPWQRAGARIAKTRDGKQFISFYTPKETRAAEEMIASIWRATVGDRFKATYPLVIEVRFAFPRPAGHFDAKGNVRPRFLDARPKSQGGTNADGERTGADVDNLLKLVKDALSGAAYADDGQVVRAIGEKWFADQIGWPEPGTEIEVRPR